MSTHKVEVVRLGPIEKHPNADSLGIVKIWGYTAIVRLGQFNEGDLAVYVEPDYVVPVDRPEFAFLGSPKHGRIRCKKLRGVWSQGLVIAAPEGAQEGDDVMELLGIERYVPKPSGGKGWKYDGPKGCVSTSIDAPQLLRHLPKYDLENVRKFHRTFVPGEQVYVSEKIHGANSRFAFVDDRMWYGSRTQWKKTDVRSWWSLAIEECPWIEEWCRSNPGFILYGEVYGVQDLRYGLPNDKVSFRAFDIMKPDFTFLDAQDFIKELDEDKRCPGWIQAFDFEELEEKSRMDSILCPGQIAEGIVIKPLMERTDPKLGRVALKLVSDRYLERAKG